MKIPKTFTKRRCEEVGRYVLERLENVAFRSERSTERYIGRDGGVHMMASPGVTHIELRLDIDQHDVRIGRTQMAILDVVKLSKLVPRRRRGRR